MQINTTQVTIERIKSIPYTFYYDVIFINKYVGVEYVAMESWLKEQGLIPFNAQYHIECSGITKEIKMHFLLKFS